jgi:3-methyl-2-oxobutanoate hydroxymethyltransferase
MKKVRTLSLLQKKRNGEKISVLTAYDYPTARLMDLAGIDVVLIGDSVGDNMLGYENTLPVTMDDMIHHTCAVSRGVQRAMVVADMPFMSYQVSVEQAMMNAGRLIKEAGAHAVKLEGGSQVAEAVKRTVSAGIPVMGHLGFTPQSVYKFGGFRRQGKTVADADAIFADARALEAAGVFSIVLELVPAELAKRITESISVPTIGIGAGPYCDGQVLVTNDLLGLDPDREPRHARKYADLAEIMSTAFRSYIEDVSSGAFPAPEHSFGADGPAE